MPGTHSAAARRPVSWASSCIWLAVETRGLLIGEPSHPEIVLGIRSIVSVLPVTHGVNNIDTLHMGPEFILATVSIQFDPGAGAERIQEEVAEINRDIKERFPDVKRVYIEGETAAIARLERGQ